MGDYIKREDALHALCVDCAARHIFKRGLKCSNDASCKVFDRVSTLPAADVRENVRAKWLPMPEMLFSRRKQCYEPVITHYMCSRCGREEKERWEFCHCGAEMRGADLPPTCGPAEETKERDTQ